MKRVLIVSPNFAPMNTPDMHRARTSLPYFRTFGWQPYVLAVDPEWQTGVIEPRLIETLPAGVSITRTKALPISVTRRLGIGNVALRAFGHLYRAGARIIQREHIDLVYISTTMFAAMALGRLWKWRLGTPYVLDMQDPWFSDDEPVARLPKHRQAQLLHGLLEPFTMRGVDGLIAVSAAYNDTLRRRYPWISETMCRTVPFGACEADFAEAARGVWHNPFFERDDGCVHGVYAGAVSDAMRISARILFRALQMSTAERLPGSPEVRLTFVGTSYAPTGREQRMVAPEAEAMGVGAAVQESPQRLPYFDALRLLLDAHFLLILGSSDYEYVPSKLFQYLLARRPLVAILHQKSPVLDLVRRSGAAVVATFSGADDVEAAAARLSGPLSELVRRMPVEPDTDWSVVAPFGASDLTRQQCALFDSVLSERHLVHPSWQ